MAVYENYLTVIGAKLPLWYLDRIIKREMAAAEKQHEIPFHNAAEAPRNFLCIHESRRTKRYSDYTGFLPVAYIRRLSQRFPMLVFNLTFDIIRDIWDEGFGETGVSFTLFPLFKTI